MRGRIGQPPAPVPGHPGGIRRPYTPQGPVINPDYPGVLDTKVQEERIALARQEMRARDLAMWQGMLAQSTATAFDVQGIARNPVAVVPIVGTPVVSFTVPTGQVLKINHIGISYSDPFIGQTQSLGWWLTIGNGRIQYVDQLTPGLDYFFFSHHQLSQGDQIEPLWAQTQETIAIQVYATAGFAEEVTVMATMSGRLYNPGRAEAEGL